MAIFIISIYSLLFFGAGFFTFSFIFKYLQKKSFQGEYVSCKDCKYILEDDGSEESKVFHSLKGIN